MDLDRDAVKAGAYVLHEGRFVFMFGFNERRDMLGVVRLGGHREKHETPVQCAMREVREECMLDASPFDAPQTFLEQESGRTLVSQALTAPRPVWVKRQTGAMAEKWTLMYLMRGQGALKPCMETQGLLCVDRRALAALCTGRASLRTMRERGAVAHLSAPLPEDMPLTPSPQVRFLHWLLQARPEWLAAYLGSADA